MLFTIDLPPGQYRNGTELQSAGRWRDANLVRFHDGTIRPVGGWAAWSSASISGVPRGSHIWRSNNGLEYVATGTHDGLFVYTTPGTIGTLTPAGLTAGSESAATVSGFGSGTFGSGLFGNIIAGVDSEATVWHLDNWGENLIACNAADGKIYEWTPPTIAALSAITNAPTDCLGALVTEERILFALGASGNPRLVAWSDQEDNTTWTASATNQAGDFELQTNGQIMQGIRAEGSVLILTDTDAHTASYVGPNDVYSFARVGSACGAISRASAVTVDRGTFWMGDQDFFVYNGQVETIPCDVADFVFGDINRQQKTKIWGYANQDWSEIWWFYPSNSSNEVDRYVIYNHSENHWATGSLCRTTGAHSTRYGGPIWFDESGDGYLHESGTLHGSDTPYAESGPLISNDGDNVISLNHLYPDEKTQGDATVSFKTRFYPNGEEREYGPYTLSAPTSVRFSGRQFRIRVTDNTDGDWRVGVMRLPMQVRGRR